MSVIRLDETRQKQILAELEAAEAKKTPAEREYDREYERGYHALMLRCGYYALAHAATYSESEESSREWWDKFAAAGKDDLPETQAYRDGYESAQARMHRELGLCGFAEPTPRANTAIHKWMVAHPGQACQYVDGEIIPGECVA